MSTLNSGNDAIIAAALGFSTIEVVKLWRDAAPSLEEARAAPANDTAIMQRMMDANYMGAGLSILIGGAVAFISKSWIPLLLSVGTVAFISFWYRSVLASDHTVMNGNDDAS